MHRFTSNAHIHNILVYTASCQMLASALLTQLRHHHDLIITIEIGQVLTVGIFFGRYIAHGNLLPEKYFLCFYRPAEMFRSGTLLAVKEFNSLREASIACATTISQIKKKCEPIVCKLKYVVMMRFIEGPFRSVHNSKKCS